MQNKNQGFIIYSKLIKDNDLFIKILSSNDQVLSGLVYGGNSSKKRLIYQLGYFIEFNLSQKLSSSVNSINGEVISPFVGNIFNDKFKSFSLLALISILNVSVFEGAIVRGLFISVKDLINLIVNKKKWLTSYCEWLLYYLKLLGYEIEYKNKNDMKYFNLNSMMLQKTKTNSTSILFPHELFFEKDVLTYESIKSFFVIFETVFKKNDLNKYSENMPVNYMNLKFLVLNKLQNINI